jgi:hypothetical protein
VLLHFTPLSTEEAPGSSHAAAFTHPPCRLSTSPSEIRRQAQWTWSRRRRNRPSSVSAISDPFPANWICPSPPPHLSGATGAFHHRSTPPSPSEAATPPMPHRLGEIPPLPPCPVLLPCSPPTRTGRLLGPRRPCRRWAPRRPGRAERGDHAGV